MDGYYRVGGAYVEGIRYHCGSLTGFTSTNGKFNFQPNSTCQLYLDRALIKEFNTTTLPDDTLVIENNIRTAQLLQSIDVDGNISNGIAISQLMFERLYKAKLQRLPLNDQEIQLILDALQSSDYRGQLVSFQDAKTFLHQSTLDKYLDRLGNVVLHNSEIHRAYQFDFNALTLEQIYHDYLLFSDQENQLIRLFQSETKAFAFLEFLTTNSIDEDDRSFQDDTSIPLIILPSREPIDGVDLDVDFDLPSDLELPDEIEFIELD